MADDSRSLTWRLLCGLVLVLITIVGYQLGHLKGYNDAAKELASRPIVQPEPEQDPVAYSDAVDRVAAREEREALALRPAGEPAAIPKS